MGPGAHFNFPKTLKWASRAPGLFFFVERPASGRKHCLKMKEPIFEEMGVFLRCALLPSAKKPVSHKKNTSFKQHAFLVDPLGVFLMFSQFPKFMFFRPQKGGAKLRKGAHLGDPFLELALQNSKRAHSDPEKSAPKEPIPSFGGSLKGENWPATLSVVDPDTVLPYLHISFALTLNSGQLWSLPPNLVFFTRSNIEETSVCCASVSGKEPPPLNCRPRVPPPTCPLRLPACRMTDGTYRVKVELIFSSLVSCLFYFPPLVHISHRVTVFSSGTDMADGIVP